MKPIGDLTRETFLEGKPFRRKASKLLKTIYRYKHKAKSIYNIGYIEVIYAPDLLLDLCDLSGHWMEDSEVKATRLFDFIVISSVLGEDREIPCQFSDFEIVEL